MGWIVLVGCGGGKSPPISICSGPECGCGCGDGAMLCGGSCIDVSDDPANCGACGHDCGSSACIDQRCQPETLAVVSNPPSEIALDGDDLVFVTGGESTSSGALYRLPKAGGTPKILYQGLGAQPTFAVARDTILVADSGLPEECRVSGSAGAILSVSGDATTLVAMGRHCARSLLPFDGGLTWFEAAPTTFFESDDPNPYIAQLSSTAAPDQPPAVLYSDPGFDARTSVQSSSTVIWRQFGVDSIQLLQMPITGGTPQVIVSIPYGTYGGGGIVAFSADAEQLVYVRSGMGPGDSAVLRSLATGAETMISDVDSNIQQITFDASFIYWLAGGKVWALDLTSHNRELLSDDDGAVYLVQDDRYLYALQYNNRGTPQTKVSRIRKPGPIAHDLLSFSDVSGFSGQCVKSFMQCPTDDPFPVNVCFDLAQDPDHCGDCMTACRQVETCTSGVCTCAAPSVVCGTDCVDLATDAANCGRCGRSCGAGTCQGGDCTPSVINEFAQAAVQDATAVYYASSTLVKRLDKQSFGVTTLGQFAYARELTSDTARLYVVETSGEIASTNPGTIYALDRDGLSAPVPLYSNRQNPRQVATAAGNVLWVEDASDHAETPATLAYGATSGGAIRGSFQPVGLYPGAEDDESRAVAVDGSVVYWLLGDGNASSGAILRIDLGAASPSPVLLTTLDRDPAALAVVNGLLYVTTRGVDGVLLSLPVTGGLLTVHVTGLFDASTVQGTADGSVYWVDGDFDGRIVHQLAPGAATPRVIEKAPPENPVTLLFDGDRLFSASPTFPEGGIFVLTR